MKKQFFMLFEKHAGSNIIKYRLYQKAVKKQLTLLREADNQIHTQPLIDQQTELY
uniref:Uncharacterized protein n=1 Tax=Anguilla anguilla TaxID=7936 RepID=A0A0E9WK13_ANGAN